MPRSYPPEFRRRVIDLVESGWPVAEVAADLGVSDQTVYNWWNHHLIDSGRKPGVSSTDNAELTAVQVGYHAVTMLMARAGLQSCPATAAASPPAAVPRSTLSTGTSPGPNLTSSG